MNQEVPAFNQIVKEFQVPVYHLCFRLLGDRQEAEDAAQETFVRAYLHFQQYDPDRSLKTWLFSIAQHYCIDLLRKRRKTALLFEDDRSGYSLATAPAPSAPEEAILWQENSRYLQKLLAQLEPKYRSALVLRYWFDLSYRELALASGCSTSAIRSRLFQAKKKLSILHAAGSRTGLFPEAPALPRLAKKTAV